LRERNGGDLNSPDGFKAIRREGVRIDWILTRVAFTVDCAEIATFSRDGQFPSDPFPVVTRRRIGPAR
jgi:hypothetical protein